MLWMLPFSHSLKNWVTPFRSDMTLEYISNMIWCWRFLVRLISLFQMAWMFLILLNMHIFSWRLVPTMYLYLRDVITRNLLNFPVSCWLDMDSKNCWTGVGSFLPTPRIQKLVLFLDGNKLLHGMLFVYWKIYDMFWCSPYCVKIPVGVPLCRKLTLTWNISYLMKGWSER